LRREPKRLWRSWSERRTESGERRRARIVGVGSDEVVLMRVAWRWWSFLRTAF
jgi:hypothetical protein